MDYETIVYDNNCAINQDCFLDLKGIGWDRGEITEISLPIFGGFTLDDGLFVSIKDFMLNSKTKSIKMVLTNRFGEEVNTQVAMSNSGLIDYKEDHLVSYYVIDDKLTNTIAPGTYTLLVYIQNIISAIEGKFPERKIFNKLITKPEGLEVTVS